MTPDQVPQLLRDLQVAAATAAAAPANAMTETMLRQVRVELNLTHHAPGMFWRATRGRPPAFASGHLVASLFNTRTYQPYRATSVAGDTAVYAAIQEFGGWTEPTRHKFMHWVNTGGAWYMRHVNIPEHPYFRPALEKIIADGSLQRSAIDAFKRQMPPWTR